MIAAEKNGRIARLMELDPVYCDVIVRRWQQFTGKRAVHERTGAEFPPDSDDCPWDYVAKPMPNVIKAFNGNQANARSICRMASTRQSLCHQRRAGSPSTRSKSGGASAPSWPSWA